MATEDRDMRGARTFEESDVDCRNLPEFRSTSRKPEEAGGKPDPPASLDSLEPRESDGCPVLCLAAFRTLVFVLVSLLLLRHDDRHFRVDGCRGLSPNQGCRPENGLGVLSLLFPSQPEATGQTLRQFARGRFGRSRPDGSGILVAVGFGEARGTLLCLAKAALLFLTQEWAVQVQFPEHSGARRSRASFREDGTHDFSAAEIYVGRNLVPSGLMVSLSAAVGERPAATVNLALLLNGMERAREEFLLRTLIPTLVSDILSGIHFAKGTAGTLPTANGSVVIVLVKPERYWDGSFAC